MRPVNVDGVRRLINMSPEELSDDEIRLALVRMSLARDVAATAEEQAERIRRFADAMDRLEDV